MVANAVAMQEIMRAAQEETRIAGGMAIRAHQLTEDMKKDSISLQTVRPYPISIRRMFPTVRQDRGSNDVLPPRNFIRRKVPTPSPL